MAKKKSSGSGIKVKRPGAFTKKAKARGMTVNQFQREVLAHPKRYSITTVREASFNKARKKWKH